MPSAAQITREYILRDRSGDAARTISNNLKLVSQASEGAARSIDKIGQGAQRFGQQAAQGARGAAETATAVDNSARAFERLERRFDPVIRAQARYAANLDIIERANDRGSVSAARQVASIERLAKSQADAATAAKLLSDAQARGLITEGQRSQILARTNSDFAKAEAAAKGYSGALGGVGLGVQKLIPLLVGLGAGLAASFGARAIIKATIEQEDATQQLGAAIASTAGIAGRSVSQLEAYATALSKTTKFADEAIQAGQVRLLAFTNVRGTVFDRATVDALDIATRKGIEVADAMQLIGKALDSPIRGMQTLRKEGVQLSGSQQQLIKDFMATGKVAEAQGVILSALETRYGGAAKAARDTLGGALAGLRNAIGELLELNQTSTSPLKNSIEDLTKTISDPRTKRAFDTIALAAANAFSAIVKGAVAAANVLGPSVKFIADHLGAIAAGFAIFAGGTLVVGIVETAKSIGLLTAAVRALNLAFLANPIGLLIGGIAAAVTAIIAFRKEISQALTGQKDFGATALAYWQSIVDAIKNAITAMGAYWNLLKHPTSGAAWDKATEATTNIFSGPSVADRAKGNAQANKDREWLDGVNAQKTALSQLSGVGVLSQKALEAQLRKTGAALNENAAFATDYAGAIERVKTVSEKRADISKDLANERVAIGQLNDALSSGVEDFRVWQIAQDMAGEGSAKTARQYLDLARAAREVEKAHEDVLATAQALEALDVDPFRNFTSEARDAVAQFARDFHDRGFKAADDLGAKIKSTFKGIVNDFIFKTVFEQPLKALTLSLSGKTGANAGGGIISNIFGSQGLPGGGTFDANMDFVPSQSSGLFSIADTFKKMLKPFGDIASTLTKTFGGGEGAQAFASKLGESFAAAVIGNETGNAIGQLLGIQKNATNANVGGAIGGGAGGVIGSFFGNPQLGAAIGSFFGNLIGGLFGPAATNAAVGAGFNPATGALFNLFNSKKGNSDENYAALNTSINSILETTTKLASLGIKFTEQVNAINIGTRDPTNIWFNPLGVVGPNFTGQKRVDLSTVGDTADLAKAVVKELLSTATASDPKIQSIISAGLDAEKTLAILDGFRKIDEVMGSLKAPTSAVAQALQTIGDTFDPIITDLRSLATAGTALNAVLQSQAQAVALVRQKFINDLKQQQIEALSPTAGQLSTVLKTNAQRLADAQLVGGGEATAVAEAVNSIAIKQFAESAVGAAGSIKGLNDAFALLIQNATAAGDSIEPIKAAFSDATAEIIKSVNEKTATTLLGLTNPVAAKWEELKKQGREALVDIQTLADSARAQNLPAVDIQGAVTAVALQQSQFIAALSAEDRAKLGLSTDSIVSLTDRLVAIMRDLDQAFADDLTARKDWIEQTKQQAADFIAAGQSLSELVTGQRDQYNPLPAKAQQLDLQARFDKLYTEALGGNLSAINAIGQVGASVLQLARQRGASGAAFQATFRDITTREQAVADYAALAGKTANERADAAQALVDLEENIKKAVFGPSPNLAALQEMVTQLGPSGTLATLLSQFIGTSAQIQGLPIPTAAQVHAQATTLSTVQPDTIPTPSVASPVPAFLQPDLSGSPATGAPTPTVAASTTTDPALQTIHKDLLVLIQTDTRVADAIEALRRALTIDPTLQRAVGQ